MATATANIPVNFNVADPAPINAHVVIDGQAPAAPAAQAATVATTVRRNGWIVPAVIAGLVIALCAAIFWPREHVAPPTATAPATLGQNHGEQQIQKSFEELDAEVEKWRAM